MKQLLLIISLLLMLSFNVLGQKITADELADRNEHLESLLLDYKEQLVNANNEITRLTQENAALKRKINLLLSKELKTDADIELLKQERKSLLLNNEILKQTIAESKATTEKLKTENQRLALDNQLLSNANKLLEEAAIAADTIQKYQEIRIENQKNAIDKMTATVAGQCARLTGIYKIPFSADKLTVVLDQGNAPKPRDIQNMTIEACYQTQGQSSNDKIIVYFLLYDRDKKMVVRDVPFPLSRTSSENNVNFFEGDFTIPTDRGLRLNDEEYFYEVKYLEKIIAKGHLKSI
ncbi:MAG: hypothetical protein AB8G11_03790 [Saprospiraceae bacterium]